MIHNVKLWTVHPEEFDVSNPNVSYDHTRGRYWQDSLHHPNLREYRRSLLALHAHFKTSAMLWCSNSLLGWHMFETDVAWELDLPSSSVLALIDKNLWKNVIAGDKRLNLSRLCEPMKYPVSNDFQIFVRWPLPGDCRTWKLGRTVPGSGINEIIFKKSRG